MRLFLAVDVAEPARTAVATAVARYRDALAEASRSFSVRWVPPDQLHLTLRFLGEVADDRVGEIESALRGWTPGPAFALQLAAFGAFPRTGVPRVLWIGLDGTGPLVALAGRLDRRLSPLAPAESRPFAPHLTVGRVKDAHGLDGRAAARLRPDVPPVRWAVERLTLFRSRLSPRGAVHEPRLHLPLARLQVPWQ